MVLQYTHRNKKLTMNPRIQELILQAGFEPHYEPDGTFSYSEQFEKFAELIVKECLYIVQIGAKNIRECDIKTDLVVVEEYDKTFKYIKEHFGVDQ